MCLFLGLRTWLLTVRCTLRAGLLRCVFLLFWNGTNLISWCWWFRRWKKKEKNHQNYYYYYSNECAPNRNDSNQIKREMWNEKNKLISESAERGKIFSKRFNVRVCMCVCVCSRIFQQHHALLAPLLFAPLYRCIHCSSSWCCGRRVFWLMSPKM